MAAMEGLQNLDIRPPREIEEEVGLVLDCVPPRLFKLDATAVTGMEFAWVYRVKTDQSLRLNEQEMSGGDWFDPVELDNWVDSGDPSLSGVFCLIWKTYRNLPNPA